MRLPIGTVSGLILAMAFISPMTGCDPLSTKDLGQQRSAIAVEGQLAMRQQDGTLQTSSDAELVDLLCMHKCVRLFAAVDEFKFAKRCYPVRWLQCLLP